MRNTHTALVGGSWALAAFQLMPPLGRSMARASGGPLDHRKTAVAVRAHHAGRPCKATCFQDWIEKRRIKVSCSFNRAWDPVCR